MNLNSSTSTPHNNLNHLVYDFRQNRELRAIGCQFYAQRRQAAVRGADFIAIFNRTQTIRRGHSVIHRRLVMAEEKGGSRLEPGATVAVDEGVGAATGERKAHLQEA